jgi:hypothetical protein
LFFFLQAKKAAAINGQPSSTPVTVKTEPKTVSTPSKTDSPKISPIKKEPTTTTPIAKKETTTPTAKKETTTPTAKKETTTPVIKKESTSIFIKKEPKIDSSPPKRKSTGIDSDDDIPLVS